jgi:hypothetical protein
MQNQAQICGGHKKPALGGFFVGISLDQLTSNVPHPGNSSSPFWGEGWGEGRISRGVSCVRGSKKQTNAR